MFVPEGIAKINGNTLNKMDALGVYTNSSITIETEAEFRLLIMDAPYYKPADFTGLDLFECFKIIEYGFVVG